VGDVIANLTATASSGGTLTWYSDAGLTTVIGTGPSLTPSGTPGVTTYYVTETSGSCESAASTVTITVFTIPVSAPTVTASSPYCIDAVPAMTASGSGGTIEWYLDSTFTTLVHTGPSFVPSSTAGTEIFYVTESNGGCKGAFTMVMVTAIDCDTIQLVVPTGFTPDGDGTNDIWEIPGLKEKFPDNSVEIFTRWGAKIFTSKGYDTPWDGSYKGSKMPLGAYYFVIYFNDDNTDPMKGTVTIIR
jgi:gliding motility-associated-like protein